MSTVTLGGNAVTVAGDLPKVGATAPDFNLVAGSLKDKTLAAFEGKRKVLNIEPRPDPPTCATSTRKFNEAAAALNNTQVLVISGDLPFAQGRFCTTEGIKNVFALSCFRDANFAKNYGVAITDGPLAGLTARAVVVLDESNKVLHAQLVPEIKDEPDYDAALAVLK